MSNKIIYVSLDNSNVNDITNITYKSINEALNDICTIQNITLSKYNRLLIRLYPGHYKESVIVPSFVDLEGVNKSSVVLSFNHDLSQQDYIVKLKSNSSIKNITLLLDNIINEKEKETEELTETNKIGIYTENQNNTLIENISFLDGNNDNDSDSENKKSQALHLYGGYNNQIKNIDINLQLGFGKIYGLYLEETINTQINKINLSISSPSNSSYGIYLKNNKNIDISYSKITVGIAEYVYGIYTINSNFTINNVFLKLNSEFLCCYGIYCLEEKIKRIDYNLTSNEATLYLDENEEFTFIDLEFNEGEFIALETTQQNHQILNIEEKKMTIKNNDYNINHTYLKDEKNIKKSKVQKEIITKIYKIDILNSSINCQKTSCNTINTLFIKETDKYDIYIKNSYLEGGNIQSGLSNVIFDNPFKIIVSNFEYDNHIPTLTEAINIIESRHNNSINNINNNIYDIHILNGIYKECDSLNFNYNYNIIGNGIDKTTLYFDYSNVASLKIKKNIKFENITLVFENLEQVISTINIIEFINKKSNTILNECNDEIIFNNVKIILNINNFTLSEMKFNMNLFYITNKKISLFNCIFIINYKNSNICVNFINSQYCNLKLEGCRFLINNAIELNEENENSQNKNILLYSQNNNLIINNSYFQEKTVSVFNCKNWIGLYMDNITCEYITRISNSLFELDYINIYQLKLVFISLNHCFFNNGTFKFYNKPLLEFNNCYYLSEKEDILYEKLNKSGEFISLKKNTLLNYNLKSNKCNGELNTLIGYDNGNNLKEGSFNILVGSKAGNNIIKGDMNICIGVNSGNNLISNSNNNIVIGSSYYKNDNNDNDDDDDNNITSNNIFIGSNTSYNYSGSNNIILSSNNMINKNPIDTNNRFIIKNSYNIPFINGDLINNIFTINNVNINDYKDIYDETSIPKCIINGNIECNGIMNMSSLKLINIEHKEISDITNIKGYIVCAIEEGEYCFSSKKNCKNIIGVIKCKNIVETNYIINYIIFISGECEVYVTNINGNINIGDLITTSNIKGIGMRQTSDNITNYTVGKCIEYKDWNNVGELVTYNKKPLKKTLIKIKLLL